MERSTVFYDKILNRLAGSFCTLEEMTKYMIQDSHLSVKFFEQISTQRMNQAKILEALILLDCEGYIFLDPDTDAIYITIKGLLKINSKTLLN
ncbi:hypothetical protein ACHRVZ_17450 [Flavobacterium sp. FlaQc-57]|uniref:hypothetical protein n=1 Tax=Flavobacterium sp. FlaQc-57 TaxID=3374186 RepID=UPI003756C0D4